MSRKQKLDDPDFFRLSGKIFTLSSSENERLPFINGFGQTETTLWQNSKSIFNYGVETVSKHQVFGRHSMNLLAAASYMCQTFWYPNTNQIVSKYFDI